MTHRSPRDRLTLADRTWPEIPSGQVVLVPIGSLEQHGPHLPLDVDTVIAIAVADGVAACMTPRPLIAPAVAFGASGEHQSFPGTVSVGTDALGSYLVELCRSLSTWSQRIVFVNGHGGNADALRRACALLREESRDVSWVPCAHGDIHAGLGETSIMLHLQPDRVRMERAVEGTSGTLAELLPAMREGGIAAVTASGVIGDPRTATAEHGSQLMKSLVARALARISGSVVDADGMRTASV